MKPMPADVIWIPHALPMGILSSIALFGGPLMLQQATLAEQIGATTQAKILRRGAWGSMILTIPVAFAFFMGWI